MNLSRIFLLVAAVLICSTHTTEASSSVDWHAWGVHEATISESSGSITAYTPNTPDGSGITTQYLWDKSSPPTRNGAKAFYSTSAFTGLTIGDITQFTWDFDAGLQGNAYFNVMVDDGSGDKGILIPTVSSSLFGTASQWGDGATFRIVEPDAGFDIGTSLSSLVWNDVKDLVITTGPFNDQPDTLSGTQDYTGNNWAAWADLAAGSDSDWEQDGVLVVFGQSTGTGTPTTTISNLTVVPEPTSLALLSLGGLMLVRRRK